MTGVARIFVQVFINFAFVSGWKYWQQIKNTVNVHNRYRHKAIYVTQHAKQNIYITHTHT